MSASVSPVCGRAGPMLSIFTAITRPSAATGSPVNGENNDRDEPVGAGVAGVSEPGTSTATSVAASPMAAAADAPITIFWRGHLMVPTFQEQASVSFRSKDRAAGYGGNRVDEAVAHRHDALDVPGPETMLRPTATVSGVPSSVTTPSVTMTEYWLGSERPQITWLMISARISSSARSKTASTSVRLMMPTSPPPASTTGRRLTLRACISRAACSTVLSGVIVTAGLVIRSAAVTPSALARSA